MTKPDQLFASSDSEFIAKHPENTRFERKSAKIDAKDLAVCLSAFGNGPAVEGGVVAIGIRTTERSQAVLMAFVRDEEGELRPAFEPLEVPSEDKAKMDARRMAALCTYAGVITWSRSVNLVNGEFGEPVVLFRHGDVPEME